MKDKKINLIPLIDTKGKKLNFRAVEKSLIDEYGRGTELFDKFNFFVIDELFPEKNPKQKYEKNFKIGLYPEKYIYIVGQQGLFLRTEDRPLSEIMDIINKSKEFISFCKNFLFEPVGIAHFSDGYYYLENTDNVQHYGVDFELFKE